MFSLGYWELLIIFVIALVVLGPTRLPEVARQIGKAMRMFQQAGDELRRNLMIDHDHNSYAHRYPPPDHDDPGQTEDEPPLPAPDDSEPPPPRPDPPATT